MSYKRRRSLRDNEKELRYKRGPNGFRLCRQCRKEVQPPRRTFCSDECVHEWKLRSDPKYLREQVYLRDLGQCARCGVDTRLQKIKLEDVLRACRYDEGSPEYVALIASLRLTRSEARKSLWQADHIRPVEDGGGECDIGNIQTLCVKCHKAKTAGQTSYRSKPRTIKPIRPKNRLKGIGSKFG